MLLKINSSLLLILIVFILFSCAQDKTSNELNANKIIALEIPGYTISETDYNLCVIDKINEEMNPLLVPKSTFLVVGYEKEFESDWIGLILIKYPEDLEIFDMSSEIQRLSYLPNFTLHFGYPPGTELRAKIIKFQGQYVTQIIPILTDKESLEPHLVICWANERKKVVIMVSGTPPESVKEISREYLRKYPSNVSKRLSFKSETVWFKDELIKSVGRLLSNDTLIKDAAALFITRLIPEWTDKYEFESPSPHNKEFISHFRNWWDENQKYIYWDALKRIFTIDQESKAAGIPTEEYRKTHPWPKEEEPDKNK